MRPTTGLCDSKSRRSELLSASGMNDVFYDVDAPRLVVHGQRHCRLWHQRRFSTAIVLAVKWPVHQVNKLVRVLFSSKDAAGNELEWKALWLVSERFLADHQAGERCLNAH